MTATAISNTHPALDVECNVHGFGALTMTLQIAHAGPYIYFPKIHPHLHKHNSVRLDPYSHPLQIKVLKSIVYFLLR